VKTTPQKALFLCRSPTCHAQFTYELWCEVSRQLAGQGVAPLWETERVTKLILRHDGEGESLAAEVANPPAWCYLGQSSHTTTLHVDWPATAVEDGIRAKLPAASAALLGDGDGAITICEDLPFSFIMTAEVNVPRHLPYTLDDVDVFRGVGRGEENALLSLERGMLLSREHVMRGGGGGGVSGEGEVSVRGEMRQL